MRFPGQRTRKHFFPVSESKEVQAKISLNEEARRFDIMGIDQTLLDILVYCDESVLTRFGIEKRGSEVLPEDKVQAVLQYAQENHLVKSMYAGGAIGNTLHNYSVLSGHSTLLMGMMSDHIKLGDSAYKYIRSTLSLVSMHRMQSSLGPIGRAVTFITPDGERSFVISPGISNDFTEKALPLDLISQSSCVVGSLFLLRSENSPIFHAQMRLIQEAHKANVPVAFSLGLSHLVREKRDFVWDMVKKHVSIIAMNYEEAVEFTQTSEPLRQVEQILDIADIVLVTDGKKGLYLGAWVDASLARETEYEWHSKGIKNYNRYEFSRGQKKSDCVEPIKIYTHVNPYLGGPSRIINTNGAGDSAFAAVLHDICANKYSQEKTPDSEKHQAKFLTYSSLCRIAQYANRVSYEILANQAPRLQSAEGLSLGDGATR